MRTGKKNLAIGAGLGTLLLTMVAACGGTTTPTSSPAGAAAAPASATSSVALSEMKVTMQAGYAAGKHTFTVSNAGTVPHELLVFRSVLTPDRYPTEASGAIAEDGAGITKISDGDNLAKGQSQTRTVDLSQPGTYLFVCNLPGHFAAHMYTVVTAST